MATPRKNPNERDEAPETLLPQEANLFHDESADLIEVAKKLESATANFQRQQLEYERVRQTQQDLKKAMGSILKGIEAFTTNPAAAFSASYREQPVAPAPTTHSGCACGSCNSPDCCCYDFILRKVKMVAGQTILDSAGHDTETTTGITGDHSGLECQFFVSIEGAGIIVPNQLWSYMRLRKRNDAPGVWHYIDRVVNQVCVPKGQTKVIPFTVQAVEKEIGVVETTTGWFDEYGEATENLIIDCNCCKSGPIHVTVNFLGGGTGGGAVELVFEAERVCC